MIRSLLCILCTFFSFVVYGTSIIIYISKNDIYAGADSRRTITKLNGEDSLCIDNACKIVNVGNYWSCLSGSFSKDFFDPYETIDSCFRIYKSSFENRIFAIHKIFKLKLETIGIALSRTHNQFTYIQNDFYYSIMTVCIIGRIHDTPSVYKIDYYYGYKNKKPSVFHTDSIFNIIETPNRKIITLGHDSEINKIADLNKKMNQSPVKTIKNAITMQSKVDTIHVNDKINLIKICKNKSKWLLKHSCI